MSARGELEYERYLPAEYKRDRLRIRRLDESGFEKLNPSLTKLRKLVYGIYSRGGLVEDVYEPERPDGLSVVYLVSSYGDGREGLDSLFGTNMKQKLGRVGVELSNYRDVAGFMRIEWGEKSSDGRVLLEPALLMRWDGWPDGLLGYVGAFTTNPLLPRAVKLDIQRKLHEELYALAGEFGFLDEIYTILAPNVLQFVLDSGLLVENIQGATVDFQSALVDLYRRTHPGYWDNGPQLYKLIVKKK